MTDEQKVAVAAAVLAVRAREKRAAKKLVRAETAMLRDVRKTVATHIDHATAGAVSGDSATDGVRRSRAVMAAMVASLAITIADARKTSREAGAKDVEPEAEVREDPTDSARAFAAASSLAAAWGAIVMVQSRRVDDETSRGTMARLVRQTMPLMESRVRRVAATESADAFNQGRGQAIEARAAVNDNALARADAPIVIPGGPYRTPDVASEPPVETRIKVWCAILDMKVCPRCADMDGRTVREDESFPGGDPPLHPFCRCTFVVVPTPLAGAYLKEALANRSHIEEPDAVKTKLIAKSAAESVITRPSTPSAKSNAAILDDAIAKANALGVEDMVYMRDGMRELSLHRAAYAGATPQEVEAIATGRMPAKNTGKILPPIKVTLDTGDLILEDGRHRMTAAIEAGAKNISATVRAYSKKGESLRRDATLSLQGKK